MTSCRVCGGRHVPRGLLPRDAISAITSARWRSTVGGARDWICFVCQAWAARMAGLLR